MFKGSYEIKEMTPGGSMSIETELDMALGKTDILAGGVAAHAGKLPEIAFTTKVKYTLFHEMFGLMQKTKVDPLKVSETLMISLNTGTSIGMVKRMNGNEIELTLKIPIVAFKGDHLAFSRNMNNHWRLIGHGEII
jgi:translation initiation factor 2 subunit 3